MKENIKTLYWGYKTDTSSRRKCSHTGSQMAAGLFKLNFKISFVFFLFKNFFFF